MLRAREVRLEGEIGVTGREWEREECEDFALDGGDENWRGERRERILCWGG